jgi:hypothetical protein
VAEYFKDHFVPAHQQVGSFEVVNNFGNLQKNGGNVASYICDPTGHVIDALSGPVKAEQLLSEAKWSVNAYDRAVANSEPISASSPASGTSAPASGMAEIAQSLASAHREAAEDLELSSNGRGSGAEKIHHLLADRGFPPLNQIYQEVFERIVGQRVAAADPDIERAQHAFERAKRLELPVLIVLAKNTSREQLQEQWNRVISRDRPEAQNLKSLAECYVVIMLPLEQMPALSQHWGVRPFAAPDGGSPLFVIARSDGRQLSSVTTWDKLAELDYLLAQGTVQEAKEHPRSKSQLSQLAGLIEPIDSDLAGEARDLAREADDEGGGAKRSGG